MTARRPELVVLRCSIRPRLPSNGDERSSPGIQQTAWRPSSGIAPGPFTRPAVWRTLDSAEVSLSPLPVMAPHPATGVVEAITVFARLTCPGHGAAASVAHRGSYGVPAAKATYLLNGTILFSKIIFCGEIFVPSKSSRWERVFYTLFEKNFFNRVIRREIFC